MRGHWFALKANKWLTKKDTEKNWVSGQKFDFSSSFPKRLNQPKFRLTIECRAKDHPNHFGVAKWLQLIIEFCYFWLSSQLLHWADQIYLQLNFPSWKRRRVCTSNSIHWCCYWRKITCARVLFEEEAERMEEKHAAGTKSQICTTCTIHTSYGPLILSNNSWMYSPGLVCKCTQNFCQPGAFLHLHPESMQKLFLPGLVTNSFFSVSFL